MKMLTLIISIFLAVVASASRARVDWNNVQRLDMHAPRYVPVTGNDPSAGQSRITNGDEATPHQFPHQVGLIIGTGDGKQAFCGGSLLSEDWVLTAAHCAQPGAEFQIILGAHKIKENETSQVVMITTEKYVHSEWDSTSLQNDIALLKLPSKVVLNENIQTIRLPALSDASKTFVNEMATASGWGKDSDGSNGISPVLRWVQFPVISNFWCGLSYFGAINNGHICTSGTGGKSTCNGDSGGPLTIKEDDGKDTQIGIVSFGISFGCEIGWPPVFTRVTSYLSWIQETASISIRP